MYAEYFFVLFKPIQASIMKTFLKDCNINKAPLTDSFSLTSRETVRDSNEGEKEETRKPVSREFCSETIFTTMKREVALVLLQQAVYEPDWRTTAFNYCFGSA